MGGTHHDADLGLADRWYDINESFVRVQRLLDADVERRGLPESWFSVLVLLRRSPGQRMAMTPLAHRLDITSGGLTKLVDKLERAGFTERQHDHADRRLVYTALTDSGRSTVTEAWEQHALLVRTLVFDTLGPDLFAQVHTGMQRLGVIASRPSGSDPSAPRDQDGSGAP